MNTYFTLENLFLYNMIMHFNLVYENFIFMYANLTLILFALKYKFK